MANKAQITRAINRFRDASIELGFKGAIHPDDWPIIEKDYARARDALIKLIEGKS